MAPEEDAPEQTSGENDVAWLDKILPGQTQKLDLENEQPSEFSPTEIPSTEDFSEPSKVIEPEEPVNADVPTIHPVETAALSFSDEDIPVDGSELPDWLAGIVDEEPAQKLADESGEIKEKQPGLAAENPQPVQAEETPPAESEDLSSGANMDEAMAWLESLAAAQGADEATLLTPPEERTEELPEWLKGLEQAETKDENENPNPEPAADTNEAQPEFNDILSAALDQNEPEEEVERQNPDSESAFVAQEDEIEPPFDLIDTESLTGEETGSSSVANEVESSPQEEPVEDETIDLPDWIKAAAEEEEPPVELISEPFEDQLPDWLKELQAENVQENLPEGQAFSETEAETPEPEVTGASTTAESELTPVEIEPEEQEPEPVADEIEPAEPEPGLIEDDTTLEPEIEDIPDEPEAILNDQIVEQELEEEDEFIPPVAPEDESVPDWLKDLAIQEESSDNGISPELGPESVSDWLEKLGEEKPEEPLENTPSEWRPEFETPTSHQPVVEPILEEATAVEPVTTSDPELLQNAQSALEAYNIERALENYNLLIQHGANLEETIHDLRDALYRYPIDIAIWQALGDAYMRSNRLQEALDAYTKAEELLR